MCRCPKNQLKTLFRVQWKYENEMRLIVYNSNRKEPHYQIKLDEASYVEAIFFGLRCSKIDIDGIKAIFARNGGEQPKFSRCIMSR